MSAEDIPDSEVLFDHLTHVLLRIVKDSPNDAFGSFESISAQVKKDKAGVKAAEDLTALASPSSPSEDEAALAAQKTAALAAHQLNLNLIKAPKKEKADGDEGDEPEEEEEPEQVPIPDIQAQHKLLNWAGVDFGAEEAYKLSLSIQKLATAKTFSETRFWGKIYGTKSNYYIVEAKLEEYPEAEDAPPELEPLGIATTEATAITAPIRHTPKTSTPQQSHNTLTNINVHKSERGRRNENHKKHRDDNVCDCCLLRTRCQ